MKSINLLGILLLLLFITSCNKEDVEPITLHYVENNSIEMVYPNTDNHSISIKGGDGKYSASCNNVSVVEVELVQEKKMILLKPRSIGNAIVTITDESGNLYALNGNYSGGVLLSFPEFVPPNNCQVILFPYRGTSFYNN